MLPPCLASGERRLADCGGSVMVVILAVSDAVPVNVARDFRLGTASRKRTIGAEQHQQQLLRLGSARSAGPLPCLWFRPSHLLGSPKESDLFPLSRWASVRLQTDQPRTGPQRPLPVTRQWLA